MLFLFDGQRILIFARGDFGCRVGLEPTTFRTTI